MRNRKFYLLLMGTLSILLNFNACFKLKNNDVNFNFKNIFKLLKGSVLRR